MNFDDIKQYVENVRRASGINYNWYVIPDIGSFFSYHLYLWSNDISRDSFNNMERVEKLYISDIYVCGGIIMKYPEPLMIGIHIADLEFVFHTKCDCGSASVGSNRHSHYCSMAKDSTLAKS